MKGVKWIHDYLHSSAETAVFGGSSGTETIVGKSLPEAKRLNVISASELQPETNAPWYFAE
jgi:hypothetical protein